MCISPSARRIAPPRGWRAEGTPALVLPPLAYGVSFVGTSFAGTLPVGVETMTAVVRDVLVGLDRYGCTAAVIINSHLEPAHAEALNAGIAQAEAATDGRLRAVFPDLREPRWSAYLSEEFRRGARHAGAYETSLMLVEAPDTVRESERQALPPVWIDLPGKLRAGAQTFAEAGATLGYFGDPATATVAEGEVDLRCARHDLCHGNARAVGTPLNGVTALLRWRLPAQHFRVPRVPLDEPAGGADEGEERRPLDALVRAAGGGGGAVERALGADQIDLLRLAHIRHRHRPFTLRAAGIVGRGECCLRHDGAPIRWAAP